MTSGNFDCLGQHFAHFHSEETENIEYKFPTEKTQTRTRTRTRTHTHTIILVAHLSNYVTSVPANNNLKTRLVLAVLCNTFAVFFRTAQL